MVTHAPSVWSALHVGSSRSAMSFIVCPVAQAMVDGRCWQFHEMAALPPRFGGGCRPVSPLGGLGWTVSWPGAMAPGCSAGVAARSRGRRRHWPVDPLSPGATAPERCGCGAHGPRLRCVDARLPCPPPYGGRGRMVWSNTGEGLAPDTAARQCPAECGAQNKSVTCVLEFNARERHDRHDPVPVARRLVPRASGVRADMYDINCNGIMPSLWQVASAQRSIAVP